MTNHKEPWVCSVCGAKAARWSSAPIEMGFREGPYWVDGFTYGHCDACGESLIEARQLDAIQCAGVALARTDLGRLKSAEIHQLRHDLGLTQSDLEAQLGVGAGTVGRWERGTVLQGGAADRLMRILWAHPELLAETGLVVREGRGPYKKPR